MHLLWRIPWHSASIIKDTHETRGVVKASSYQDVCSAGHHLIKKCSIALAGLCADRISIGPNFNWKQASHGGGSGDMVIAQTAALKHMSVEHYAQKFAKLVMEHTINSLEKNWGTVQIIAEELQSKGTTTPAEVKPLLKAIHYPQASFLNGIMAATEWKNPQEIMRVCFFDVKE